MENIKELDWYVITGLKIGDYKKIADILKSFCIGEKKVLFKHYFLKLEDLDEDIKNDLINDNYEAFCDNIIFFNKEENKLQLEYNLKNILFENLVIDKDINGDSKDKLKEQLLTQLYSNDLENVSDKLMYDIKELISQSINEDANIDINEIVNTKACFINNEYISFRDIELNKNLIYTWYELNDEDEMMKVLEIEGFVSGIITEDLNEFDNYIYAFELFEQNNNVLAIKDMCGNFYKDIVPILSTFIDVEKNIVDGQKFIDEAYLY